jgi:hypothetical protein
VPSTGVLTRVEVDGVVLDVEGTVLDGAVLDGDGGDGVTGVGGGGDGERRGSVVVDSDAMRCLKALFSWS